jgi:Fic family protein
MLAALDNFEKFLHDQYGVVPPIVKAGLAHAQFETIHPFLDGNGRIGRLLISLLLVVDDVLTRPFLYLSLYFREHRAEYYDALQRVRTHGDWEGWLRFYVTGVEAVARQAGQATLDLIALFDEDRKRVQSLGRVAGTTLLVYDLLRERAVISIPYAAGELDITWPTAKSALQRLESLGIAKEISGRRRDRVYAYGKQLEILDRGTGDRQ